MRVLTVLSKKKLFCFWHHTLPNDSGFYIHCSVMKNQWSRRIFLKTKKKCECGQKRLGRLLSLPLLRGLVFRGHETHEWLVTKRKEAWEKRGAKSRPFSPSRPTSFPEFRPTRPIPWAGEAWGSLSTRDWGPPRPRVQTSPAKRTEGSGDENDFHRERDLLQGSFFLLQGVAVRD